MLDPPSQGAPRQVTLILGALQAGEREASEQLLPLVYADLRKLAAGRMARLAPGQTLQATELVHEAYVRLVGSSDPGWQGRAHFFGAAARAMRDILADHLQRKASLKRGGHMRRVGEDTAAVPLWGLAVWIVVLGTIAPFWLVLAAIRHIGAAGASIIGMTEPFIAALVAWVVLNEVLTPVQLLGGAVILTGVVIAERARA